MNDALFSTVTSIYTVGGLVGSMVANVFIDRWGRKGTVRASTVLNVAGSGLMALSGNVVFLMIGRYASMQRTGTHCSYAW